MIEAEIRRRLVADRGVEAMARTLRKPLPEDVDFMHASREEMQQLQKAIYPLTRALAARLAQRRRHRHRGTLDFRQTVRHSMSYGGVPVEPKFKRPRPSKPEIMVVADISGSVASFARFTLQFVYAMQSEFSKVRSWVFIDGVDEVTRFFDESDELGTAIQPRQHRSRRRVGRRPLRLRPRVRGVARAPHPRGDAEVVDHPARRRAQQLPRVAGVDGRRDAQAGPPGVLARSRAPRLLGHRRLDRLRVRARTATASTRSATSANSRSSSKTSSASNRLERTGVSRRSQATAAHAGSALVIGVGGAGSRSGGSR